MPALRTNILTNYAGQVWTALMAVAFVPLYIRALGMEAFGLVGLMLSMQALSMLLDLGMGSVLNRELARRTHDNGAVGTRGEVCEAEQGAIDHGAVVAGQLDQTGLGHQAAEFDQMAGAFASLHDPGSCVIARPEGFSAAPRLEDPPLGPGDRAQRRRRAFPRLRGFH